METTDFLIVGAGIVGLSVARELRRRHPKARIAVLEKEPEPGLHASGRNSGVLHSGIYYTPGTLKARFCAEGARRMIEYAGKNGIPCRVAGKLIVAGGEEDLPALDRLMANALGNGVRVERLSASDVQKREPYASPFPGLFCRDTAVIDPMAVLTALAHEITQNGVKILFNETVVSADKSTDQLVLKSGKQFSYGFLFNCAGAHADQVARLFGLARDHALVPFKGLYYQLRTDRSHLVRESIYPVPDLSFPFLGIHLTRGVSGTVYVGPTAIPALGRENYGFLQGARVWESLGILSQLGRLYFSRDPQFRRLVHREMGQYVKSQFLLAAQRLIPSLRKEDLLPSVKIGIRPQLVSRKDARLEMDFRFESTPRSLHVLNAISPAFTCSLAFAEAVVETALGGSERWKIGARVPVGTVKAVTGKSASVQRSERQEAFEP